MSDSNKRRNDSSGGGPQPKKSKGGNGGKWQTPQAKAALERWVERHGHLQIGDAGFWVTCQRSLEHKAVVECAELCDEYGEKMYGIKPPQRGHEDVDEGDEEDIEAAIQKEINDIKAAGRTKKTDPARAFSFIRPDIECVFFVKTRIPADPIAVVRKICEDALTITHGKDRKARYINRFTPVVTTGRATEAEIARVAREVLAPWFELHNEAETKTEIDAEIERAEQDHSKGNLVDKTAKGDSDTEIQAVKRQVEGPGKFGTVRPAYSYAIRPTLRQNHTHSSLAIIQLIAGLITSYHKVNLSSPDKVIAVEIFQNFCGMSVLDGPAEWDGLRKFNMAELYKAALATNKDGKNNSFRSSKTGPSPFTQGHGDAETSPREKANDN